MDWDEFMAARQLLAEEFVGVPRRQAARDEEEQAEAARAAIRKHEGV